MKIIPEIQVTLTEIEIKALIHCVRMAEAHIVDWQFHDKREKESVKIVRRFLRKCRKLKKEQANEIKKLEESKDE